MPEDNQATPEIKKRRFESAVKLRDALDEFAVAWDTSFDGPAIRQMKDIIDPAIRQTCDFLIERRSCRATQIIYVIVVYLSLSIAELTTHIADVLMEDQDENT